MLHKAKRMSWVSLPVMSVLALSLTGCGYYPSYRPSQAVEEQVLNALQPEQLKVLMKIAYCGDIDKLQVTIKLKNDVIYHYHLIDDKMVFAYSATAEQRERYYSRKFGCLDASGPDIKVAVNVTHMPWPVGTFLDSSVSTSMMLEQPFDDKAKRYIARATDVMPDVMRQDKTTVSNENSWQAHK